MPKESKATSSIGITTPSAEECVLVGMALDLRVEGNYSDYDEIVVAVCATAADLNNVDPSDPNQVTHATLDPDAQTWYAIVVAARIGTQYQCEHKEAAAKNFLGAWGGKYPPDPMDPMVWQLGATRIFYAHQEEEMPVSKD